MGLRVLVPSTRFLVGVDGGCQCFGTGSPVHWHMIDPIRFCILGAYTVDGALMFYLTRGLGQGVQAMGKSALELRWVC